MSRVPDVRTRDVAAADVVAADVVAELDAATCSDGAPSARNLIVTVFGDTVLPSGGAVAELTVRSLARLIEPFGVNERLVRTSLSRVVSDGLLTARSEGRHSYYSVAGDALATFVRADRRIYRGPAADWDGDWTIVVIDGTVSTAGERADLRRRLGWAGFGSIAPNVMASPVIDAEAAAELVGPTATSGRVLIARSRVSDGVGLVGSADLVRRTVDLDAAEAAHGEFTARFERFDDRLLDDLDAARCLKLRLLLVSSFRRIALSEPEVPTALLPEDWAGHRSRRVAARVYEAIVERADRHAGEVLGLALDTPKRRFEVPGQFGCVSR